jgi:putative FmdB family regulatory protein
MPIFDYVCFNTGCSKFKDPFEMLVSNRNEVVDCPKCQSHAELIITKPSYFHLKGSWPGKDIRKEKF